MSEDIYVEITAFCRGVHSSNQQPWHNPPLFHHVKLDNNIRGKTVYLVCEISDVINYSVTKVVFVSLNLNECRMPTGTVPYPYKHYI